VVNDNEEYVEENDYDNEWNIRIKNNNGNKDEEGDQELSSTDDEEELNELRKMYKDIQHD
jgi:hypothetical protein